MITRESIPAIAPHLEDATSVFNPGAIMIEGRYLLMLRVQSRGRETFLVMAESPDGIEFDVRPELVHFRGIEQEKERIYHVYDPRITEIEGSYYVVFAADTDNGCRLGVAQTRDFETFELVGLGRDRDIRNGVLLPERLGDRYVRLARPNTQHTRGEPISGDQIVLSESNDLVRWKRVASVA
ncbi:MAG: hypothetical protein AMS18_14995, partial [Gemmatimonas sp. SG8_17]